MSRGSKKPARSRTSRRPPARREAGSGRYRLYGLHAVNAALANPARTVHRIFATPNAALRLEMPADLQRPPIETVHPRDLDQMLGRDAVHQGVLIDTDPLPAKALEEASSPADGRLVRIVVLDQVTDPQNVGAILRSAAAFGATGLVMTERHSPPLSGPLAKAASGGLEHVPVILVTNLARALAELTDLGILTIGLDGTGDHALEDERLSGTGVALVLGAEGKGLRRLTTERCERLCRIKTCGPLASLNVSNAAAVALHTLAIAHEPGSPA